MCTAVYVRGERCESVGDLRRAVVIVHPYRGEELDPPNFCLCNVDLQETAKATGYTISYDDCADIVFTPQQGAGMQEGGE